YQQALQADPKNKGALLGMARLYARIGEQERADEVYRKYLSLYPKDHAVVHEVAVVHGRWKDWAGAAAWCEAALKIDSENRDYRKTLGFCQARAGNWDGAFTTLSQLMPEAKARMNLAGMLDHMGQTDACKQQLQLAIQADPTFVAAREMLAELEQGGTLPPTTAEEANPIRQTGGSQPR
ncbi:MAG TPA: tetratricopeptide repeat protein, partial [Gemmataceae bacterium]|nr:tetratricopeptide repeat protein [Gemmataceae bacterium]